MACVGRSWGSGWGWGKRLGNSWVGEDVVGSWLWVWKRFGVVWIGVRMVGVTWEIGALRLGKWLGCEG
ncbi:hypothetical protein Pyn_14179 [Prunus yedoensis var. nudiflora]|uniref:Uncharacterized protein n=1 Tax=Prunus yedoensis var. nudiflora TaxID=2094558 RepID=A0A314U738_PRUYE|nr:hypothetical protein Pyn_14179 [Prunus yedoensis var. nudiflora]